MAANKGRATDPKGKTPIHNLRIPDDLWDRAKARADAEGRSMSWIIRYALQQYADGGLLPDARPSREGK